MNKFAETGEELVFGSEFWTVITKKGSQMIPSPPYTTPRYVFEFTVRRALFVREQVPGKNTLPAHDDCILAAVEGVPLKFTMMFIQPELVFETSDDAWEWIRQQYQNGLDKATFMLTRQSNSLKEE